MFNIRLQTWDNMEPYRSVTQFLCMTGCSAMLLMLMLLSAPRDARADLTASQKALFTTNGWTITEDGSDYRFEHTGVVDSSRYTVGSFPDPPNNPNTISTQNYRIYVPRTPAKTGSTTCTSAGFIGMSITGATFFNPHTFQNKNAVDGDCAEVFDGCQGHPDQQGVYHYHSRPSCVSVSTNEPIGIALDGFLIYDNKDESGATLTSSDLDSCGGRTGVNGDYRYHTQTTYPYILGCFSGSFSSRQSVRTECHDLVACGAEGLGAAIMAVLICLVANYFH